MILYGLESLYRRFVMPDDVSIGPDKTRALNRKEMRCVLLRQRGGLDSWLLRPSSIGCSGLFHRLDAHPVVSLANWLRHQVFGQPDSNLGGGFAGSIWRGASCLGLPNNSISYAIATISLESAQ